MSIRVTLPLFPYHEPLDWAKEHCPSYITNDFHQDGYTTYDQRKLDYFFADERDAMLFALRWA